MGAFVSTRDPLVARDESLPPLTSIETSDGRRAIKPQTPRIEVQARPVIAQLVHAARSAIDGTIEVKLSPEELGRVRLAMTSGETGMTVQVTAERQETLDLIRRNIDLFAADLTEQGFADLSFSFNQESNGDPDASAQDGSGGDGPESVQTFTVDQAMHQHRLPEGRLDIRL